VLSTDPDVLVARTESKQRCTEERHRSERCNENLRWRDTTTCQAEPPAERPNQKKRTKRSERVRRDVGDPPATLQRRLRRGPCTERSAPRNRQALPGTDRKKLCRRSGVAHESLPDAQRFAARRQQGDLVVAEHVYADKPGPLKALEPREEGRLFVESRSFQRVPAAGTASAGRGLFALDATRLLSVPLDATIAFVHDLTWNDVPEDVRERARLLQRDLVAVSLAGRATPAARIAADHATEQHPGADATALVDGRRLSTTGAAWANGVLANALDFDDGHRLVKGHPGANVVPTALAVAEATGANVEEYLTAVIVGYEVALRAGLLLHARSGDYHGSGSWGAVGAAAASARLLGLSAARTRHALGFAEYHAPLAPIMRSVAEPAMTKDACGWGALLGVSAAYLAARDYTALECTLVDDDAGALWHLRDVYVKSFPCCRWSQPAIQAALELHLEDPVDPGSATGVYVRTFAAAAALARHRPRTTEEAQYSLTWPVAVALSRGAFGVDDVLEPAFSDEAVARLAALIQIEVAPELEAAFPGRRLAQVTAQGRTSDVSEAPGEPGDPGWAGIVEQKFAAQATQLAALPSLLAAATGYDQG